jgi:poly(A) polymerase
MSSADRPLAAQPWLTMPASRQVLTALAAGGRPARFVGGCVRDALLGLAQAGQDLDLATPERPEQIMARLAAAGLPALPIGLAHGTVATVVDGTRFEITTLRRDVACDGRHAEVEFTDDFEADAARRDFTINAMSCDAAGRLFDYFGGRADLAAGRVRFIGEAAARVREDYLRILRFFRFFARYGRPPADPEALAACAAAASELARLSGERIGAEMLKLLAAADPVPALRLMAAHGILPMVLPPVVALERLERLLARVPDAAPLLRLAALLRPPPAAPAAPAQVATRWRLSKRQAAQLAVLAEAPPVALDAPPAEQRQRLYRLGAETFADLARLAAAEPAAFAAADAARLAAALAAAAVWQAPRLPVTGDDLRARGVPAGPALGRLLAALEAWWLAEDMQPPRAACLAQLDRLLAAERG